MNFVNSRIKCSHQLLFKMYRPLFVFFIIFMIPFHLWSQSLPISLPIVNENLRRHQLLNYDSLSSSMMLRPLNFILLNNDSSKNDIKSMFSPKILSGKEKTFLSILPVYSSFLVGGTPYPEASVFLQSKGFQSYISSGVFAQIGPLSIQLQPEFIFSSNLDYDTGPSKSYSTEYLEKFGEGSYSKVLPGQSSIRLNFGAFSAGVSTENIWWGPGQFNALLFSNNAFGFEHLTFNTRKPAKTFLGSFEGQIIVGELRNSNLKTTNLTDQIYDSRYVNGLNFIYQPKWIKGFNIGFSRVFQQYISFRGNSFDDYFPIFEPFQKINVVEDVSDSGEYDEQGQDQQITVSLRYVLPSAKAELYFEYGRRDHAFNWRDATLNPEHARAYLFGFKKLFSLTDDSFFQVRGEVLQQQESVNILIRYPGTAGSLNWSGNGTITQGFTHRGQMLGPGVGPSSNVQTLEGAWVKGFKKIGLRLERLNRYQDFYQKEFPDPSEQGRWVDFSAKILADWQCENLIIGININFVNSLNYQWQFDSNSTPSVPKGKSLLTVHGQVSVIYLPNLKTIKSKKSK